MDKCKLGVISQFSRTVEDRC